MNQATETLLKAAADALCTRPGQRELINMVYDLGFKDGQLAAIRAHLDRAEKEAA